MSGFVKLDAGILDSSLWAESSDVCKVFITMLAMCEPDGLCRATAPGISKQAYLPVDRVREALERLEAVDPDSRSSADEGRRIRRVDGGYLVTNYTTYRQRDYTATERKRRQRERERQAVPPPTPPSTTTTTTDADAYAYESQTVTPVTRDSKEPARGGQVQEEEAAAGTNAARERTTSRRGRGRENAAGRGSEADAIASRFIRAFNITFGRRVTALPALVADVGGLLAAGYGGDQLVAVPILTDAQGLPADLRAALQPRWLLRTGAHPRTGHDGKVNGAKDWIAAALDRADRVTLWPRHVEAARSVGVLDALVGLGARVANAEAIA